MSPRWWRNRSRRDSEARDDGGRSLKWVVRSYAFSPRASTSRTADPPAPVNRYVVSGVLPSVVTPPSDDAGHARLVVEACDGSRQAFGELYTRFSRAVHGVLIARVSPQDADDLVQDVFLHAWPRLGELRDPAAFAGWICTIARRRAVDHLRRARLSSELTDVHATRDRPDITAEASAALAAIRSLPEAYRETLALRLVDGLTGPEIAAATGLTADSVRVNLHRGFKLLLESADRRRDDANHCRPRDCVDR